MESVSRYGGAFFNQYLNPLNPDQTLSERVFKVFLYGLGIVLLWVVTRPKSKEADLDKAIEGRVWVYIPTTGAIGKDQHHRFGAALTLPNGDPLQVMATDLYVNTVILDTKPKWEQMELPSSLFIQAEGDKVSFRKDGQLYELTLSNKNDQGGITESFDQQLEAVERYWINSRDEFLYPEDVPDTYKRWSMEGHPVPIYLSPETKQVRVGEKGATSVDFSQLQPISTLPKGGVPGGLIHACKTDQAYEYVFAAVGEDPTITILVDRHHLYVHHHCKIMAFGKVVDVIDNREHASLFDEDATADYENIEAQLLADGFLRVTVPFIPK